MNRMTIILLSFFLVASVSAQPADSSKFTALGVKLREYYEVIKDESLPLQQQECDFLIESASDSSVRQFIARSLYGLYMDSPVMGAENVAVHIFDKWFADGNISMSSPEDFADARNYADFNRNSLIGKPAPQLSLETLDGEHVTLFGQPDAYSGLSILLFYDAGCPKCKLEIGLLNILLASGKYPVRLYAVYAGDNRDAWVGYIDENFRKSASDTQASNHDVVYLHLWDPDLDSDFQRKYGVTQTPRMFLVAPDGMILGRGLDAEALAVMLEAMSEEKVLEYGTPDSEQLFDGIFAMSSGKPSAGEVKGIADYIHDRTLAAGDTLMFRQMAGDYLYYLSSRSGEGFREGMRYHIDRNILSRSDVWRSPDDSLKVVGFAGMMSELLSKAAPGSQVPPAKVSGELYVYSKNIGRKSSSAVTECGNVTRRLDHLKGERNIIIFYTEGCQVCEAEKKAALSLPGSAAAAPFMDESVNPRKIKVFMVNVDRLIASDSESASQLMDAFDLSSLPYIIMTDSDGTVLRRYISLL